jgi:hypothetical protein
VGRAWVPVGQAWVPVGRAWVPVGRALEWGAHPSLAALAQTLRPQVFVHRDDPRALDFCLGPRRDPAASHAPLDLSQVEVVAWVVAWVGPAVGPAPSNLKVAPLCPCLDGDRFPLPWVGVCLVAGRLGLGTAPWVAPWVGLGWGSCRGEPPGLGQRVPLLVPEAAPPMPWMLSRLHSPVEEQWRVRVEGTTLGGWGVDQVVPVVVVVGGRVGQRVAVKPHCTRGLPWQR